MPTENLPALETWYQDLETGRAFRVVAVDEDNESIDIQYDTGDIDGLDFPSWRESTMLPIEAPEDASAPFDDLEIDDLGYSDTGRHEPGGRTLNDLLDERDAY
jgi:hypothetical protein